MFAQLLTIAFNSIVDLVKSYIQPAPTTQSSTQNDTRQKNEQSAQISASTGRQLQKDVNNANVQEHVDLEHLNSDASLRDERNTVSDAIKRANSSANKDLSSDSTVPPK
jgi:hypothetical protein